MNAQHSRTCPHTIVCIFSLPQTHLPPTSNKPQTPLSSTCRLIELRLRRRLRRRRLLCCLLLRLLRFLRRRLLRLFRFRGGATRSCGAVGCCCWRSCSCTCRRGGPGGGDGSSGGAGGYGVGGGDGGAGGNGTGGVGGGGFGGFAGVAVGEAVGGVEVGMGC